MALKKCKECGHQISSKAKICPGCGVKNKRTNWFGAGIMIIIFLVIVNALGSVDRQNRLTPKKSSSIAVTSNNIAPSSQQKNWGYDEKQDKMGRGSVKTAITKSMNVHSFKFPYSGAQFATLMLRKHPKHGNDVIFSIERGQFTCDVYTCKINIRFDEGKAKRYLANKASDHSTETIFIRGYDKFIKQLKKSSKVYIEATYYHEGDRVFEFNTKDLEW